MEFLLKNKENKMNILILLKSFNYPPSNGGDQAVFNAIDRLSKHVQFHIINTDGSEQGRKSLKSFCKDYPSIPGCVYDLNRKDKYQRIKSSTDRASNFINNRNGNKDKVDMRLLNGYDARLDYYYEFYQYLNRYIVQNEIDVIQAEFHFTLGFLKGIAVPVKKVFVQHEIQFVVEYQRLIQHQYSEKELYFYKQLRQQEINAMNACDAIITLSQDDKIKLINNGVHTPIFASFAQISLHDIEINYPVEIINRLVFIGPETHMPNKQGVEWFLNDVFPLIRKVVPDTKLDIIGRWSSGTVTTWKDKYEGLDFLGFVDDLPKAIANSILIVPLFQGSGIRMKILEACNVGIPFVSTSIGAEGLGFTSGKDCFIEDDNKKFANDVITILTDNAVANRIIKESQRHIGTFTDSSFVKTRMNCYNKILDNDGAKKSTMD